MSAALPLQRRYLVMRSASALCRHGREKVPEGKFLDLAAGCLWKLRLIYVKDEFGYYGKIVSDKPRSDDQCENSNKSKQKEARKQREVTSDHGNRQGERDPLDMEKCEGLSAC
ncbi:hypothetical protein CIRG_03641 [Coccidioides immitis RMSCC 2394]|uniref:Uncharacterized protein n=1 Tax=Coccidioides immitis RMSCC 2394 TaxID=404692 RepID=A0A0J6YA86_COCIT|nr:hypothetical protein CIRG_03641 [Coccidioides immitis RMSCC 2394]